MLCSTLPYPIHYPIAWQLNVKKRTVNFAVISCPAMRTTRVPTVSVPGTRKREDEVEVVMVAGVRESLSVTTMYFVAPHASISKVT